MLCYRLQVLWASFLATLPSSTEYPSSIIFIKSALIEFHKASEGPKITSSEDTAILLMALWNENKIDFTEQFKILMLNRANWVLGIVEISSGGVTGTVADLKLIFAAALKANACGIIISHNLPSCNLRPSMDDEELTQKIKQAGQFLDITLLDHAIVTSEDYFSFANEGLL